MSSQEHITPSLRITTINLLRFNMVTSWLTFLTLLGSADSVTVAPTARVKGQPLAQLMLRCGEELNAGEVQFWHTPFGDLQTSDPPSDLAPVFLNHDGSLVIPSCSAHHGGLYYCIQQHSQGSTLWPYELHVGHQNQSQEVTSRFRKEVVSDGLFAGAVTASVLLTFTVGFSAGALARTHVLRCLRGIAMRLRLPRKRLCQTDMADHSSQVTMATLPPVYDNQVFEAEAINRDSPTCGTPEESVSMTTPSPPAKPKRSFRHKRQEEKEATASLVRCDHRQEEEAEKQRKRGSDGEAEEEKEITEDEEIESEADEDHREQKDGGERSDERREAAGGDESDEEQTPEEDQKTETHEGLEQKSTETEEKTSSCVSQRSSRVIRLYQYDEDGQRFSHLPEPGGVDPEPGRRLRVRSLSLTRLNAIMMAASTGPMEGQREGPQHFHMEI